MSKILCKKCSDRLGKAVFYKCVRLGVKVRYGYYNGCFRADLWECPVCGHQIVTGFSSQEDLDGVPDYDYREQ